MVEISGFLLLIVALVDGLLFGLAIKKGILSFVLLIIAMFIAAYVGFAFVPPHVSISSLASSVMPYVKQYVGEVTKSLSLGFGGIALPHRGALPDRPRDSLWKG